MMNTMQMPELPQGWKWTDVKEVGDVQLGRQRSPKHHKGPYMRPYLRVANVFEDRIDTSDVKEMNFTPEEYETYKLEYGDILLNEGQSLELVGRPAMFRNEVGGACFQNTLIRFRAYAPLNRSFALLYFRTCLHTGRFQKLAGQTISIAHLGATRFSNMKFPVPPLPEQRRIAEKIEELFSDLDAGVSALRQVRKQLQRYRQAVLKAAVEGKLTEAWRQQQGHEIEPAGVLLERILAERRRTWEAEQLATYEAKGKTPPKNWQQRYKEPAAPDTADLADLPDGWVWVALDAISNKITDGEHLRPGTTDDGVYFLSAKDVRDTGVSFKNPLYVSTEDAEKFRKRCDPEQGDILIVSRGATVGRSCIVNTDELFCLLGSVILIKLCLSMNNKYISLALKSPSVLKQLVSLSGSTAQQAIYIRDIRGAILPIPSFPEQEAIAEELDRQFSIIDELESVVAHELQRAERLRQSILKRAFEGKLVPQDPSDEPASVLLERIREEKKRPKAQTSVSKKHSTPPKASTQLTLDL